MPGQKRNKSYYANASKKARYAGPGQGRSLCPQMRGFLVTCNNREKEAVREAYNLFNEYADRIIGPENNQEDSKADSEDGDEDEDIEAAFEKEKKSLVAVRKQARRFQMVDSGANNCIFIKTTLEDPNVIVDALVSDIFHKKEAKARYILRLIPILGTCKAYDKNMIELAEVCLKSYFAPGSSPTTSIEPESVPKPDSKEPESVPKSDSVDTGSATKDTEVKDSIEPGSAPTDSISSIEPRPALTYSILFKTRNNNQVKRDDAINTIATVVKGLNSEAKVDFKAPDLCIVVEIIRSVCCIGVVKNYYQLKKYNLVEMVKDETDAKPETGEVDKTKNGDEAVKAETAANVPETADVKSKESEADSIKNKDVKAEQETIPAKENGQESKE